MVPVENSTDGAVGARLTSLRRPRAGEVHCKSINVYDRSTHGRAIAHLRPQPKSRNATVAESEPPKAERVPVVSNARLLMASQEESRALLAACGGRAVSLNLLAENIGQSDHHASWSSRKIFRPRVAIRPPW